MTNVSPVPRTTRVPTRTRQLALIHQAAHRAGFQTREDKPGRELYEAELLKVCGRTSSRQATRPERLAILSHFEALEPDMRRNHVPEFVSDADALAVL